jgi:Holliday junction resolvasome RuvABC endonuclease subunit
MHILALDVGFANTGLAVIDADDKILDCGTIITEKSKKKNVRTADDYFTRATILAKALENIIGKYQVNIVVGELPTGGAQSAIAMVQMGMALAITASVLSLKNIPSEWATPNDVKLKVCGYRSATKKEIMSAIKNRWKKVKFHHNQNVFEHIADALGAYLYLKDSGNLIKMFINNFKDGMK